MKDKNFIYDSAVSSIKDLIQDIYERTDKEDRVKTLDYFYLAANASSLFLSDNYQEANLKHFTLPEQKHFWNVLNNIASMCSLEHMLGNDSIISLCLEGQNDKAKTNIIKNFRKNIQTSIKDIFTEIYDSHKEVVEKAKEYIWNQKINDLLLESANQIDFKSVTNINNFIYNVTYISKNHKLFSKSNNKLTHQFSDNTESTGYSIEDQKLTLEKLAKLIFKSETESSKATFGLDHEMAEFNQKIIQSFVDKELHQLNTKEVLDYDTALNNLLKNHRRSYSEEILFEKNRGKYL